MSSVHLRVQDIHYSNVVTGLDETACECGPNESCPTGNEHGLLTRAEASGSSVAEHS